MPIYDKPMIYYPLTTLIDAGIQEVLIITTAADQSAFESLLWDWSKWWMSIQYCIQPSPDGLAQAFILWEEFIGNDDVCLILWDNIFYGESLSSVLAQSTKPEWGIVFAYPVSDPQRYGVVEFDKNHRAISIEEKPIEPKSRYAVPWIYFFDKSVVEVAKNVTPSARGELEITSVNDAYLQQWKLKVWVLNRWTAWLDTWTIESMIAATQFVQVIEKRQWLKIGCPEEAVWRQWWISDEQLTILAKPLEKSGYGIYLQQLITLWK